MSQRTIIARSERWRGGNDEGRGGSGPAPLALPRLAGPATGEPACDPAGQAGWPPVPVLAGVGAAPPAVAALA